MWSNVYILNDQKINFDISYCNIHPITSSLCMISYIHVYMRYHFWRVHMEKS